ncbi:MAG TPA: heme ABC exporter ATP-binding protein CcmA [Solirubrobacteraceae bacterium]|jgi:heme exporter protein A
MTELAAQSSDEVPTPLPASPHAPPPALRLEGLTRHYGERTALGDVSLTLAAGQTLVVLGSNGAGKTTLLRLLATLLRPHAGVLRVLGSDLPDAAWAVRGRIGLLGHEPLLYRELTPRENLRFHARLHGVHEERVEELLDAVGLAARAREPLRTLSRGLTQRVAIARAVLHDPELLLLDEPRANLDPAGIELVEDLIGPGGTAEADLTRRIRTRVLCSHDPAADLPQADLVLGLRAGRQALLARPSELDADAIAELYR